MRLRLVKLGKSRTPVQELVADYQQRLKAFATVEREEWRDAPEKASQLVSARPSGSLVILLDERGSMWKTTELAEFLRKQRDGAQVKTLTIGIGGPFGFDDKMRASADVLWSLSPCTLPSDLAWLLVWEQIYRAYTILAGTPYHHA